MKNIIDKLNLNLSQTKLDFENQVLKIVEKLWKILQTKKWDWNIKDEVADLILESFFLANSLWFNINEILEYKIKKNNDKEISDDKKISVLWLIKKYSNIENSFTKSLTSFFWW